MAKTKELSKHEYLAHIKYGGSEKFSVAHHFLDSGHSQDISS